VAEDHSLIRLVVDAIDLSFNFDPVLKTLAKLELGLILFAVLSGPFKEFLLECSVVRNGGSLCG